MSGREEEGGYLLGTGVAEGRSARRFWNCHGPPALVPARRVYRAAGKEGRGGEVEGRGRREKMAEEEE